MLVDDERRDFKRLIAETDVTITRLTSGDVLKADLVDLSASGCAFHSDPRIELDEELEILVRSPSDRIEPLRRAALVVRVTQSDQGRLVGVRFLDQKD
ncbi:PilZ domain-containing protein [Thiocystis violacea]|uniref:PilZ domain-containing protein n=1 Tax=Thiocystis violacea TaxID=13725 RepID=UPI0019037581|nr:PilZ domain-containing protein [Thiocystis violacea]MBK1718485.1 pilus assembly protein PilZ [Thiocystis violacea]